VRKTYQTKRVEARAAAEAVVPRDVAVALGEIVESAREGLLALAVGAGLQVMAAMMAESVTGLCGPVGRHHPDRVAYRHGTEAGSVTLGGRRVPVRRPRVRAADGSGELPVPAYELFAGTEVLGRMAMERMLAGLSTRRYPVGLEPVGEAVEQAAAGTSRSAVSRRFVAATETALKALLAADLSAVDLVAVMVDRARQEREELAGRADGAALVRRRHGRSRQTVPPRQRPPAPDRTPRRTRACHRRNPRTRPSE